MAISLPLISIDASRLLTALYVFLFYCLCVATYRLFLSPLRRIPGPKLAALTRWYEFYYDVYLPGRFTWAIADMHARYGPIVRIGPNEVHVNDISFYDEIYPTNPTRKRNKTYFVSGSDGSTFQTLDHDAHRRRRTPENSFFSTKSVLALEPLLQEKVNMLLQRFVPFVGRKVTEEGEDVLNLNEAFGALTMDVISHYCFGESMGCLSKKRFAREFLQFFHDGPRIHPVARQFPWLFEILLNMPAWFIKWLDNSTRNFISYQEEFEKKIHRALNEKTDGDHHQGKPKDKDNGHRTIFHDLRASNLPPAEKTVQRFTQEAGIFLGAGTETTARAIVVIAFNLIENKEMLDRLRMELKKVMPRPDSAVKLVTLQQLPYLTGVIQEGIRLSFGVIGRLPRIAPNEVLKYGDYEIPPGTAVSESAYLLHTNPKVFIDPFKFEPQRWIDNPRLDRNFVPFGRGARSCLGMNLGYAEIYICIAKIFRRFDFEFFETTRHDVEIVHDYFIGQVADDSKGIRVQVVGELKE